MAEGTYEYECMRAELLGIDKPDYDTFVKEKELKETATKEIEDETIDTEKLKECETQDEQMNHVTGGLEEINHLLSLTQKKIDRFKVRCNSITSLLKMKVGSLSGSDATSNETRGDNVKPEDEKREPPEGANSDTNSTDDDGNNTKDGDVMGTSSSSSITSTNRNTRKTDLTKALDNHVDKLDGMLDSADNAYHSMSQQNKQMKKFLN